ncbi:MAG TPA: hypothetical protein VNA88_13465 [Candidatus Kapabacteria bacterium]|jgi:hypothetical protein|nr:hypothetical protein [Candidatus Kapabacteria bacterium]
MRRLLASLVVFLPLCLSACASYAVHLYSDPRLLQVIDERIVLTDGESDSSDPLAVLMRGDSVVVIGERRNNWEYEQDMHDRTYVVYYNSRRAYVPYRSLITREQYASMYGVTAPATAATAAPAAPSSTVGTGGGTPDSVSTGSTPTNNPTGGPSTRRRRR